MKIAYFDCFSGISGDMCLGSLVGAGVPIKALAHELKKIPITGYRLSLKQVMRTGIAAHKVDISQSKAESRNSRFKKWRDVREVIHGSSLSEDIKQKGLKIFRRLFEAEAEVHGESFHNVHLHELGAVDCIIDIFGTVIGLNMLGIDKIYSSPINTGNGFVKTDSGILPVPALATANILRTVPIYSAAVKSELTTPTGAAIIREMSCGFGNIPFMNIEKIGIGAGDKDFEDLPNVLRVFVGEGFPSPSGKRTTGGPPGETVTVIETNIDDMNPQIFEYAMERLFKAGALDVYLTPIIMKKGRPALTLTVLCFTKRREDFIRIIFEETSTIGLRFYETERKTLPREIKKMDTEYGKVRVKYSTFGDRILKATPEYEDCRKLAQKLKMPLIEVMKRIRCSHD